MIRILIQQTKNYAKQQNRQYSRPHRYRPNAGVRRQSRAETNEIETESSEWDDDLSKYEGDLSNTTETYEEYRQESKIEKEKLKRYIVRNKYFNEKKVSFLTWAEMAQIRLLNAKDPEEWNDQKLAESFPADSLTIKKVLKSNWQPRDAQRIAKHDEKVQSNWKSFVNGEISDIDPEFSEHLRKFSTRKLNQKIDYDNVLKKEMPKPESTEFLGIITSCKKYKEEPKQILSNHLPNLQLELPDQSNKETYVMGNVSSQKLYTFKPSNSNKDECVSNNKEIIFDNPSGTGIKTTKQQNDLNQKSPTVNAFSISKYGENEVQLDERDMKQLSMPSIRHHVDIPEKLFKEGATYRLGDCYYDDDGEFLYRVPGMTSGST